MTIYGNAVKETCGSCAYYKFEGEKNAASAAISGPVVTTIPGIAVSIGKKRPISIEKSALLIDN